jgi:hypothetical protein
MIGLLCFALAVLASPFKSKLRLEAENAVLRHQLMVLRRRLRGRVRLTTNDRWFFIQLYRRFPSILQVLTIIRPETLVRWHRAGFRRYWRWIPLGGRPQIETERRALIRQMSMENPLWGAPRIHGELLKLGIEVAQSSVAKYMVKRRGPPSQGWRTFLRNHAPDIAAMDLFGVPTIGFDLLYAVVIVRLDRKDPVWINVTTNPTAEWIARQITEAFPWMMPQIPHPRSGSNLWRGRHLSIARHGHPGQAHCTSFTLAKWLCRTADRIDPAQVFGPHHCLGRGALCAGYSNFMPTITMGYAPIFPWRRIHRSRAPSSGLGTFVAARSSADCTTNMSGFDLRQGQLLTHRNHSFIDQSPRIQYRAIR